MSNIKRFQLFRNLKNFLQLQNINGNNMKFSITTKNQQIIEKKVEIGENLNLNYVQSGGGGVDSKTKKGVLLMPGALGSAWTDFKPQIELLPKLLNDDHILIAWDPPGYGKSIPPHRNFPLDFFHKDALYAKNLMEKLGWKKFSILGWSDGGITGLILAGKYTDTVEKLIIWGTGSYINEHEMKIYENIRDVSKWSEKMRQPMENLYGIEEFPKLWSKWIDGMSSIYKQKNGDLCKNELEKIKAKTLIVHGKKDPMIASEHIPYLREKIKDTEYYEFPDGKHNLHLRYSDEFNKIVADFLNKK